MSEDHDKDKHENRLVKGYERMLERLEPMMQGPGALRLREALDRVKKRTVELGELSRKEAEQIGEYLRRDIEDAANYAASGDDDLRGWLYMDVQMIENWIWDRFSSVADQTSLELLKLKQQAQLPEEYHTGEIAAPGALGCMNCDEVLHFKKAGHIPPCPKCHGSRFIRPASQQRTE